MKRSWIVGFAALLLVAVAGVYFTTAGHAPAGQPPLIVVDAPALSTLQAEFNRAADGMRAILLLSPT